MATGLPEVFALVEKYGQLMKNSSITARDNAILAAPQTDINHRAMLLSLMLPFAMQVLNLVMFGVALAAITAYQLGFGLIGLFLLGGLLLGWGYGSKF